MDYELEAKKSISIHETSGEITIDFRETNDDDPRVKIIMRNGEEFRIWLDNSLSDEDGRASLMVSTIKGALLAGAQAANVFIIRSTFR